MAVVMKMFKLLTVMLVCVFLNSVLASDYVTGRCCEVARKDSGGGGGCPNAATENFYLSKAPQLEDNEITWDTHELQCPPTHTIVYYDINNGSQNQLVLSQDEMELRFRLRKLFPKQTSEYCVEVNDGGYRGAVCQPDPEKMCDDAVCIPKCCGEGEILRNFACVKETGNISLPFYAIHGQPIPTPSGVVMVGDMVPNCGDKFPGFKDDISDMHLLVNGKLLERAIGVIHEMHHYCIEDKYEGEDNSLLILVCNEHESKAMSVKNYLQKFGYVVSLIFLVVTTLFHIFIPSLQDTQGLCLVSHMVAMAVAYLFLLILSVAFNDISKGFCLFSGFIFNFSFLAMFSWLNIMCFDIWRVIRHTAKGMPLIGILSNDVKKFRFYCAYGWGIPLVVTVVAAIMHTLPEEHAKNITPPGFGRETCWITGDEELLLYCYGYVAVLFILDLTFLGHTIFILFQAGNAFRCFSRQVSVTAFNRKYLEAFWQRFSLFILMVLCWTADLLSWKIPPREMWIPTDVFNSLQGFLVFIIFISNRKRRDMSRNLFKKVPLPCCRLLQETTPITGAEVTLSPQGLMSNPSTTNLDILSDLSTK